MINTTPSNKRNLWKYAVVLPLLTAFFFMFQIETVAQVRDENKNDNIVSDGFSVTIDAKTTDANFKELEELFTDNNLKLKFSNVKRNKAGEITRIKIEFHSKQGEVKEYKVDKSIPIETIELYKNEDQNSDDYFGFRKLTETKNYEYSDSDYEDVLTVSKKRTELNPNSWTLDDIVIGNKKAQLIINGKLQTENKKIVIPNDNEIDIMKQISTKKAKEKYNLEVKEDDLFYEITTKKVTNESFSPTQPNKNQLYIINGKEYKSEDLKGKKIVVDGSIIHYFAKDAIKKFGDKGKNGVLVFDGKSTISEGTNKEISYEAKEFKNIKPKNIKLNFEKGKTYLIGEKKYSYEEIKDKNLWLYAETPHKIEEKNGIVTISGDVLEDAGSWNSKEIISLETTKSTVETRVFELSNGKTIIV